MTLDWRSTATRHRRPLLLCAVVLLLLRSRLLKIPQEVVTGLLNKGAVRKLSQEELAQALQQVYVDEADGSKSLLVPYREGVSKVCGHNTACVE